MTKLDIYRIYEWPLATRSVAIGIVCVIVLYLGYYFDISNMRDAYYKNKQQEDSLKDQFQNVLSKEKMIKNDISQFTMLQDVLNQWQKKIITYSELPKLLNEILKTGANNQIHFSLFNPGAEIKDNSYLKVPVKIIVVGGYHQLGNFISQIANMSSIIVIRDFTISNENKNDMLGSKLAAQANAENLLTSELKFEIYYQPEKK